jgi:predicted MPP superfamily phosphohydrolase
MDRTSYRNPFALALAGLGGGAIAVGLYAVLVERRRLEVRRSTIHVRSLPPDLEGLRIALLSDFHAGRLTPPALLRRAVRETMEQQPHIIALAGDFVDRAPEDLDRALLPLRELWAPLGVYAVPGNHDHVHSGLRRWREAIADTPGLQDLTNRCRLVERGEATLCIVGVDDLEEGDPELVLPPPASRDFTLLLAHNPEQAERTRRHDDGVDLILAGHTHGGQVRLPAVGALHRKSRIYDHGLRRRPWTQVYTSRGLGTTFLPIRLNARPELAILELTAAPRPRW